MARQHDKQFDRHLTAGFFLADLMTAMTLLALVSIVGLRVMQLSETTFTEGRIQPNIQQKNQAIRTFIKHAFKNKTLSETRTPIIYRNTAMPGDLQGDHQLNPETIFGKGHRFAFTIPKCVHLDDVVASQGYSSFAADCQVVASETIANLINVPLKAGARSAFAIDVAGTRCTAIIPIKNTTAGDVSTLFFDDPGCLKLARDPSKTPPERQPHHTAPLRRL